MRALWEWATGVKHPTSFAFPTIGSAGENWNFIRLQKLVELADDSSLCPKRFTRKLRERVTIQWKQ